MNLRRARWRLGLLRRESPHTWRRFRTRRRAWKRFWEAFDGYSQLAADERKPDYLYVLPQVGEDIGLTEVEPLYFFQDAWAFEAILRNNPEQHVDVGSHHKFVALLSKVCSVVMVDIRPLSVQLDSLEFRRGSILDLPFEDGSLTSVSSLCVIEHIGLGRYGDVLDPYGTEKASQELKRVVAPGGHLYVSVPLDDDNRTYFNAHRAFTEDYLLSLFEPFLVLQRAYIYGNQFMHEPRSGFGTGCYELIAPLTKGGIR